MSYRRNEKPFGVGGVSPYAPVTPDAPGQSRETAIGISDLNEATRQVVENSFGRFWVRGEVTDFKSPRSGHWFFALRDASAQMPCVVWASEQRGIPAPPDDGMQVLAQVELAFYTTKGNLQLRIMRLEAAGDGLWRKAMEQTIARLTADGLMAPERKRSLPRYPRVIGVVTSTTGAALRDILSVARRRRPGLRIAVSGAAVQGEAAPEEICRAIHRIMKWGRAEVLIVGRGGGSREDLWAFNDERVARAVAGCRIPVISAVGHAIDTTVCDLVADVRAATPSAAAETAIPSTEDMVGALVNQRRRLTGVIQRRAESAALELATAARDMRGASLRSVERHRASMSAIAGRLSALSPLAVLSRGYAVARSLEGQTLGSVADFSSEQLFQLILHDGRVGARVEDADLIRLRVK